MEPLSLREIEIGYRNWYRYYEHQNADTHVRQFLNVTIEPFKIKSKGQLQQIRRALFLTLEKTALKLKISTPAYMKLEESERLGTISVKALAEAAEALNCELIYA